MNRTIPLTCTTADTIIVKNNATADQYKGVFRTPAFPDGFGLAMAPGRSALSGELNRSNATGFEVSEDFLPTGGEANNILFSYCYYAIESRDGWLEYGTYVGTGADNFPLVLTTTPTVFIVAGQHDSDLGMRVRTVDMPSGSTYLMDGTFIGGVQLDDVQRFMNTGAGDPYTGVELGTAANVFGRNYWYISFIARADAADRWVFHGKFTGTGTAGDLSSTVVNVPCANRMTMLMSTNDTLGLPIGSAYLTRFARHLNIVSASTNYAQRFNATDITASKGDLEQFNAGNFIFGNSFVGFQSNMAGYTYYYWGLCE